MKLQSLRIHNFRAIDSVRLESPGSLAVIAGPNAVGKTSLFEAIRLAKCILAPAYSNEAQEVLTALGAMVPGGTQIDLATLAGDPARPVEITASFNLSEADCKKLTENAAGLALQRLRASLAVANFDNSALAQYLSTPVGAQQFEVFTQQIAADLVRVNASHTAELALKLSKQGIARGGDPIAHESVAFLSGNLDSYLEGLFSYFPADRAMPLGEAAIQVGANDANAQRSSHFGHAATKFTRLKNFIVSQTLLGQEASTLLNGEFNLIFTELLSDKEFATVAITPRGRVSATIRDKRTGRLYDIDQLSSGEKGLLLTFLLIRLTVARGGIVLIDEPELHLNAAVCRRLLGYIKKYACDEHDLQVLVCTHSPEILADAYAMEDCHLFHLRSSTDITPIIPGDRDEVNEALRRLGARPIELLYSRGFLYVEGPDDVDLIEAGFPDETKDIKLSKLHGRSELEKHIKDLQAFERDGKLDAPQYFLFDHDNRPTGLKSSEYIRLAQWERYCLENFLLDPEAIYDVAKKHKATKLESRGLTRKLVEETAMANLRDAVVRKAVQPLPPPERLKLSATDALSSIEAIAVALADQFESIRNSVLSLSRDEWMEKFLSNCRSLMISEEASWRNDWRSKCDGKVVLRRVFESLSPKCAFATFKRDIMIIMAQRKAPDWAAAKSTIELLLTRPDVLRSSE